MEMPATRHVSTTEEGRRWFELWSEYEATKNEVIGVIENASALGEAHSQALLAMARCRQAQLEQALLEFAQTVMIEHARNASMR